MDEWLNKLFPSEALIETKDPETIKKEHIANYAKKYYKKNKERLDNYKKEYYKKNKEKILEKRHVYIKHYYKNNKERIFRESMEKLKWKRKFNKVLKQLKGMPIYVLTINLAPIING